MALFDPVREFKIGQCLLLSDGKNRNCDDFVEAHIFGGFNLFSIEGQGTVPLSVFQARIGQWMTEVQAATGRTPIVYSYPAMLEQFPDSGLSADPLWIANYGVTCPLLPAGWH